MKFLCLVFITNCHYCSFHLLVNQLNYNLRFDSYLLLHLSSLQMVFCFVSLVLFYTVTLFSYILFLISQFAAFLTSYPYLIPSHYPVHSTLKMLSESLSFNPCTLPATGLARVQLSSTLIPHMPFQYIACTCTMIMTYMKNI